MCLMLIDESWHRHLQIMTKNTANIEELTKLWPSKVWLRNGTFGLYVLLGSNFANRQLLELIFAITRSEWCCLSSPMGPWDNMNIMIFPMGCGGWKKHTAENGKGWGLFWMLESVQSRHGEMSGYIFVWLSLDFLLYYLDFIMSCLCDLG